MKMRLIATARCYDVLHTKTQPIFTFRGWHIYVIRHKLPEPTYMNLILYVGQTKRSVYTRIDEHFYGNGSAEILRLVGDRPKYTNDFYVDMFECPDGNLLDDFETQTIQRLSPLLNRKQDGGYGMNYKEASNEIAINILAAGGKVSCWCGSRGESSFHYTERETRDHSEKCPYLLAVTTLDTRGWRQ